MKHKLIFVIIVLVMLLPLCLKTTPSSDKVAEQQSEQIFQEAAKQLGLPNITNFQQKKTLKMIFELCDQADLIRYAYVYSDYNGQFVYMGKCAGYGIPFSAQYTNPEKIGYKGGNVGVATLPQADPNGLFMPTSSSATWVVLQNPANPKDFDVSNQILADRRRAISRKYTFLR
jgi:hypothetical protein